MLRWSRPRGPRRRRPRATACGPHRRGAPARQSDPVPQRSRERRACSGHCPSIARASASARSPDRARARAAAPAPPARALGGEAQRVAVAVALANQPDLLLADEVTGELDSATAEQVMDVIFEAWRRARADRSLVTHSDELAARAEHRLALSAVPCTPCDRARRHQIEALSKALRDERRGRAGRSTASASRSSPAAASP